MTPTHTSLSEHVKFALWLAVLPICAILAVGSIMGVAKLYDVARRARSVDAGLVLIERRAEQPDRLRWSADDPGPRPLERATREAIAGDYLAALDEMAYAQATGDGRGLRTYLQEGPLDDALAIVPPYVDDATAVQAVDWDHEVRASFYAPDGATVAFTDRYRYAWTRGAATDTMATRIGEREIQVVMTLDDGNWRIHHWRVVSDTPQQAMEASPSGVGTTVAAMRGANYIAPGAPFDAFWPAYPKADVETDFERIAAMGLNAVRVFVPFPAPPETWDGLAHLLDTAERWELAVIPTLFDGYSSYAVTDLPAADRYLDALAPHMSHPAVVMIDAKNEPDLDVPRVGSARVLAFLEFVVHGVRARTHAAVTVGTAEPDPELAPWLDAVSIHHYGIASALPDRIRAAASLDRPVIVEEFGFHTLQTALPDPHTEAEQARYFEASLDAIERGGAGWLAWTLHDIPRGEVPGDRRVERHLGLLRSDGSAKPVVGVLMGDPAPPSTLTGRLAKFAPFAMATILLVLGGVLLLVGWRRRLALRRR